MERSKSDLPKKNIIRGSLPLCEVFSLIVVLAYRGNLLQRRLGEPGGFGFEGTRNSLFSFGILHLNAHVACFSASEFRFKEDARRRTVEGCLLWLERSIFTEFSLFICCILVFAGPWEVRCITQLLRILSNKQRLTVDL